MTTEEIQAQVGVSGVFQIRNSTSNSVLVLHICIFKLFENAFLQHLGKVLRITSTYFVNIDELETSTKFEI